MSGERYRLTWASSLFMFSVSWLTAFKIIWRVDEEEDVDELEEESWLELVDIIFHSAAGCELSIILESVPRICGKMSRESVSSDSQSFKIIWRIGDGKSGLPITGEPGGVARKSIVLVSLRFGLSQIFRVEPVTLPRISWLGTTQPSAAWSCRLSRTASTSKWLSLVIVGDRGPNVGQ